MSDFTPRGRPVAQVQLAGFLQPINPGAWLVSAGRFRAIDRLRRERRFAAWDDNVHEIEARAEPAERPEWVSILKPR